jgi:hypothetical protein
MRPHIGKMTQTIKMNSTWRKKVRTDPFSIIILFFFGFGITLVNGADSETNGQYSANTLTNTFSLSQNDFWDETADEYPKD